MADLIDRLEITELLNRHQIYIDLADADGYAGLYAANGVYESPFASATGRTEIAKMFQSLDASGFTVNKRHFTGPIMIELEQDRAATLSYWWVADHANDPPTVFATGTYKDDLQKVDGVWRIARRMQSMDSANARRQVESRSLSGSPRAGEEEN
jgi:hypothetical protein